MNTPLYKDSAMAAKKAISPGKANKINTGLWFTRFYNAFEPDWSVGDSGKRGWIDATVRLGDSGAAEQLSSLGSRQERLCTALGGMTATLETDGPFVTGMGLSHPVENGFAFHPTLGVPYLPASGVKGLLRGWVEAWMDHNELEKKTLVERWFGIASGEGEDAPEGAGNLIFFDALPVKPVKLECDIMTPHMGSWYEKGGDITVDKYAKTLPADWHSPVPVPFLVVQSGAAFRFMIAPRLTGHRAHDAQTKQDVTQAMQELRNALEWIGAGAKTGAGYGRMVDRVALKRQEAEKALQDAGIANQDEQWPTATLSWHKGKQTLTVSNGAGKSATLAGPKARAMFDGLSEPSRNKLNKEKPVSAHVTVRVLGNQITLVSIKEQ